MKKQFTKMCSMLLVLVMLLNILPMCVLAEPTQAAELVTEDANLQTPATSATADPEKPVTLLGELTENRTEFSKEFLLSNGVHMATIYPQAVHYEAENGWAEIDNTLKVHTDGTLGNTAGVWEVQFPQQITKDQSISVTKDGYTLSFFMAGELTAAVQRPVAPEVSVMAMEDTAQPETFSLTQQETATATVEAVDITALREGTQYPETVPDKNLSRLRYSDIYANTDIVYDLQANMLKESVILEQYNSALRGYRYTLHVGQLQPVLEEDGTILFYNQTGETLVMVMPAPYLVDSANGHNDDITVQLTGTGSTRTLTYLLPTQWLAAEDRAWPVILDPIVQANLDRDNIEDRTVTARKVYSEGWGMNSCGYNTDTGIQRFYLKYKEIPALTSSDVILSAKVTLYKEYNSTIASEVEVRSVATQWNEESITWANKPTIGETIEDYAVVSADGWYTWTITDIVRGWYHSANTGMAFKCSDAVENGTTVHFRQFASSEYGTTLYRPNLQIYFRNDNGLEDYWDYTSVGAGRAGTGHVNNYTGSLTWVRSDMSFGGNRMPVAISFVYNMNDAIIPTDTNNSNDTGGNYFGLGSGWRTNFHQRVYRWSEDNSYYVWEDSDGTDHYFTIKNGVYKDEDGLELTLTTNGTGSRTYCITDKMGSCRYFDSQGRLTAIENNQQTKSTVTVEYVSGQPKQISKITDGVGRIYYFAYSGGLLQSTRFVRKADGTYEFFARYQYTGDQLTGVTYKGGMQCSYTYNSDGILTSARDPQGYQVDITHHAPAQAWQPYRVSGLSGSQGENPGGSLSFEYGHNQTVITDYNQNQQILQFNDFGNLVAAQDNEGRAAFLQYDKMNRENTGAANQRRLSSKLQNTVSNLMKDSSFEGTAGTAGWGFSATGPIVSRTTEQSYMGQASMKLDYSTVTAKTYAFGPSFQVQPGETVTVSAYVKATAGALCIALRKSGSGKRYEGEYAATNGNCYGE